MKNKHCRNLLHAPLLAAALASGVALAGVEPGIPAPISPAPSDSIISGTLSLDFNTHFISYGADVYGDGGSMSSPAFNPSVELNFALPGDFTFTLGTWWDVNSKNGGNSSPLGSRIQEVDVYYGLSYSFDKLEVGLTYQNWIYDAETEDVLDLSFSYDTFLSPSLTIHHRLNGGETGTVIDLGISHDLELGPVSLSFPLNVGFFLDDDYYFPGGDDGFGYGSLGVAASLGLGEALGGWTLNASLTYYITDGDVTGNSRNDFLTAGIGVSVDF